MLNEAHQRKKIHDVEGTYVGGARPTGAPQGKGDGGGSRGYDRLLTLEL